MKITNQNIWNYDSPKNETYGHRAHKKIQPGARPHEHLTLSKGAGQPWPADSLGWSVVHIPETLGVRSLVRAHI